MKRFFILITCALLTVAAVAQETTYNIVYIGNSITYGALHKNRERTAPPAVCSAWLNQQEGVAYVYFRNCGRSGRTTYHFLPRQEDVVPQGDKTYFGDVVSKARDLVREHPEAPLLFSIKLGTNDAVERAKNHATTPENYLRNLTLITDSLLALWPDAHIVLHQPIWNSADYTTVNGSVASKQSVRLMAAYTRQLPKLVKRHPGHIHMGDTKAYGYFSKHWKTDLFEEKDANQHSFWLHPNEQGAEELGIYWGKALYKVMKKL